MVKQQIKEQLNKLCPTNFLLLLLAGCINALGVTLFLAPVKLYDSGISGTSMLLDHITPEGFTLSLFLLILNVPLFVFGYKRQGMTFTIYSIFAIVVYSLGAWVINDVIAVDFSQGSPFSKQDLLLCAIFGGMISGVGSGMTIRFGGAIDGIEVMAVIFAKKLGMTVGTFVMIYNVLLYVICGIVMNSWILPLYSVITYMAALKTIDFIVEGIDRSKGIMIITDKAEEVAEGLMDTFETGATIMPAVGGYSKAEKNVVYFIVNRFQIAKMRNLVHAIDPKAYMTITEVADVFTSK